MSVYTTCPRWVDIYEDTDSVRSPGWYVGECWRCKATTSGSEPVVEEWADEHAQCGYTALETLTIKRGTARRLGIRQPPQPRLLDMQASINGLHRRMRAIRSAYGIESCFRAGQESFPSPCRWHGSQFA